MLGFFILAVQSLAGGRTEVALGVGFKLYHLYACVKKVCSMKSQTHGAFTPYKDIIVV